MNPVVAFLRALIALALAASAPALAQYQGIKGPQGILHGHFARVVTPIPDANGDGRPDVAVSAIDLPDDVIRPFVLNEHGRVFIYSGATGGYLRAIIPATPNTGFGHALAGLSDVNGDARGDLAVAAPYIEGPGLKTGRVFIYSGATGQWVRTIAPPAAASRAWFGWSLAAVPDMNGDGRGEVLVGGPLREDFTIPGVSGHAFLFSGATGSLLRVLNAALPDDFNAGTTVLGAPDLNGDAKPDLVMGGGKAVYVYSGATGQLIRTIQPPANAAGFGLAIASMPDANGDGRSDLVVGAPLSSLPWMGMLPVVVPESGRAYLYSGATGALLRTLTGPAMRYNHFGHSIAGIQDINGDGRGDIAIGAPHPSDYRGMAIFDAGAVHVYNGATGQKIKVINSPNAEIGGQFGSAVAGLDTNANGRGDLFIGAPYEDPGGPPNANKGRGYFVRH